MPSTLTSSTLSRGHKKKARTRQLLLDTALDVLAERGEGFSVADLAVRAGVSHGTFYNYFTDRDALVEALVPHLVGRFAARMADEVTLTDPAARFARISSRALGTAVSDPLIARVALRLDAAQQALLDDGPFAHLRRDLVEGQETGRFNGPIDAAAVDVIVGALLLAARRIADGETGVDYRIGVLQRLLQSLGLPVGEAAELAARAMAEG